MTKYESGAKIEREIRKKLEDDGFYVIRSAGSKGCFDLVAFNDKTIKLIQVKYTKNIMNANLNKEELKKLKSIIAPKGCIKEVWFRGRNNKEYKIKTYG